MKRLNDPILGSVVFIHFAKAGKGREGKVEACNIYSKGRKNDAISEFTIDQLLCTCSCRRPSAQAKTVRPSS